MYFFFCCEPLSSFRHFFLNLSSWIESLIPPCFIVIDLFLLCLMKCLDSNQSGPLDDNFLKDRDHNLSICSHQRPPHVQGIGQAVDSHEISAHIFRVMHQESFLRD